MLVYFIYSLLKYLSSDVIKRNFLFITFPLLLLGNNFASLFKSPQQLRTMIVATHFCLSIMVCKLIMMFHSLFTLIISFIKKTTAFRSPHSVRRCLINLVEVVLSSRKSYLDTTVQKQKFGVQLVIHLLLFFQNLLH